MWGGRSGRAGRARQGGMLEFLPALAGVPVEPANALLQVPIVQRPRTWPFQGQNTGSNPVGDATLDSALSSGSKYLKSGAVTAVRLNRFPSKEKQLLQAGGSRVKPEPTGPPRGRMRSVNARMPSTSSRCQGVPGCVPAGTPGTRASCRGRGRRAESRARRDRREGGLPPAGTSRRGSSRARLRARG